ncbi:MAG: response regulator transcription factor [Ferruginibacter sp.]|nr:response regulator transcription factor [Cytophagales bacterium]
MKSSKIVVIDDEKDILEILKYNLEKEKAFVQTFTSGNEALRSIREQTPDLIVCDWMIDDLDGLDICRRLKRDPGSLHIPFVMLTARGDEIDAVTALELGADEYLVKPIRIKELITRLKKVLGRNHPDRPAVDQPETQADVQSDKKLIFKELLVNIDQYKAYAESKSLDLTYSEFKLLQLLISRPGKVYSRNQIIEKLNGMDYFATERSIDVQVVGLRKKLGKYKDYLETVRGVGYRMQE